MTELDHILQTFEERFRRFKGRRLALYPGEYLDAVVRRFGSDFRFRRILDAERSEAPTDADAVVLTDCRKQDEPDYRAIWESCERKGTPLLDLFGLDLIEAHRELDERKYLTISQWKEKLADYDVVSLSVPKIAVKIHRLDGRWILRRRFLILYNWLKSQGKTVLFLWDQEEQLRPLEEEGIELDGNLFERKENDPVFLRLARRYPEKRIVHVGVDVVKDGIVPREYGLDSRLARGFSFKNNLTSVVKRVDFHIDKNSLLEAIDRCDVVSFDVFDTLIKRIVPRPNDVFEIVEARTGVKGFAEARIRIQTNSPRLTLDEMYDWLKENCGYDEQTIETLRQSELQTESDVILPRKSMTEVFEYAKSQNKPIVLVSDMYLPPAFMRELLEKNGITGYQALIISNQFRLFKREGLFEELRDFRKNGETILHIGDNRFSDYSAAKKDGLDVFYVPSCLEMAKKNGYADVVEEASTLAERKALGLGVAVGFDDPFAPNDDLKIANMIVAPLIVGYLTWAIGELKGKGYDYFLFSSRDGWILQDAYDKMRRRFSEQLPPGKYFYVNRRAAILTVMDNFKLLNYLLFLPFKDDPPKMLRQLFCVPENELLPYAGESAEDYYRMHEGKIHEAAERYRENYRRYLVKEGLDGKKCALMDFVSEGNSQMMLENGVWATIDGYYVGIPEYVYKYARNIRYYLDHDLINYNMELKIEAYFTSPEPSLDHIGANGTPVFAEEVRDRSGMDRIKKVHNYARQYLTTYLNCLYEPGDAIDKELIFKLCASVNQYNVDNFYYDDMTRRKIRPE